MKRKICMAQPTFVDSIEDNITKTETMMEEAAAKGAQLICFPEVGFYRFFPQDRANDKHFEMAESIPGRITDRITKKAKELKIVTIISLFEEAQIGEYYDSAVCIDNDGEILGITRMTHTFEAENYNEKFYYGPGNINYPVFKTAAGPVGIAICYDGWFPEVMRALALRGAELIVIPTAESCTLDNHDWYLDSLLTAQGKGPAIYNGVFVGSSNRVGTENNMRFMGSSYVASPYGKILGQANRDTDENLIVEIDTEDIRQARQLFGPMLRDRRPETYGVLLEQWASKYHFDPKKVEI